jgi:hypothetical protein
LFFSNPLLDLFQILNNSSLGGVKCFSQNFNIIGLAARELHLPEVEGVEVVCFFLKSSQGNFSFEA